MGRRKNKHIMTSDRSDSKKNGRMELQYFIKMSGGINSDDKKNGEIQ